MKKILILLISLVFIILVFGKINVSSVLLKPAIDELKDITGLNVSIERIYLNFIPLYLEFKNISFFTEDESLTLKKAKLYVGLTRILSNEIETRRAVLYSGNFSMKYSTINRCIENISEYLKKPLKTPIKIKFNSFEIENLSGSVYKDDLVIALKDFYSRVILKIKPEIFLLSNVKIFSSEYPNIDTNLKASFKIKNSEIVLEEMKVFGLNGNNYGEINIDGKLKFVEAEGWMDKIKLNLNFNGSFLLEELMKILKVSEKLSGYTEAEGKIEGLFSSPLITGKAFLKKGNILEVDVENVNTEVTYSSGILEFKNGKLSLYGGYANAHVWITLPKVGKHYVFIDLKNVSSKEVFKLIKWDPKIAPGRVNGWLLSQGERFSPKGSFVYLRKGKNTDDVRGKIDWIKGDFENINYIYKFNSLEIALPKTRLSGGGFIDTNKNYLQFNFVGKTKDVNELLLPYQNGVYGILDIQGRISGITENPEIVINFSSPSINVFLNEIEKSIPYQSVQFENIKGEFIYKKNLVVINHVSSNNLLINGKILFPEAKNLFEIKNPLFDVSFSLKNIPVKNLYKINTSLDLNGFIKDRGTISADIIFHPIFFGDNKVIDKAIGYAVLVESSVFIKTLDIYNNGSLMNASGYINFGSAGSSLINISGKSKAFDITSFAEEYTKRYGLKYIDKITLKTLSFSLKGSLKEPILNVSTNLLTKIKNGRLIDAVVSLNYQENHLKVKSTLMKNISLVFEGFTEKNLWNIKGSFNSSRIDSIARVFTNNLPEDLVVLIDGEIKGLILNKNLNAQIELRRIFTKIYSVGVSNKNPVSINIKDGNVYFNPITLLGQSTELTIKGKIVDYFEILIEGSTDLRPFKTLFKADDIRGRASIEVYIYESRKNPEIAGGIDIDNASITLKKDIPSLSNVNATISFNKDRVVVEKASGNFSEGIVHIDGTVYLEKLAIKQLAISGKFSGVRWIFAPKCWAYLDGQVYLTGEYSQPLLAGHVNIQKGIYTERFEWTEFAFKRNFTETLISKDRWLNNINFNLRVQTNNFFVNNNLATVNLDSDLLLKGSAPEPSLIGWINAKEGWIYFRGNRFEIIRLLIQFNDPDMLRPYLNISARTNISQYNINLNLNGYIDQFNLILSSNPPLSESDLLNMLVLGQNAEAGKGVIGASEAASFITGQIQEVIEERIRGLTGLDVMAVKPEVSKATGSITPRITVGKRLMDGRMNVTYSTSTGTTAEQIIKIEYFVKRGVSFVGIRDEIGELSGAIKFRFEFH